MFYTKKELIDIGFKTVGEDTRISKKAVFYGITNSSIGDCVRIDDFSTLKGNINLGSHIHISSFCSISGTGGSIKLGDFSGMSTHCSLFTAIEDFINPTLTSPSIDPEFSTSICGNITMKEASKLGSGCILLPKVTIGFGASVSANTIVSNNVKEGAVIGPKSRHFKTYGYRDIDKIRELMNKYQKNE
jgi:acetyltransferase-like isoleucine patch superfamily enzyme